MVRSSRDGHQRGPGLQKHLTLTHIAPDPKCCQVHRQVVLLGLGSIHASINGLFDTIVGTSITTIRAEAVETREKVLPVHAGCCDQRRTRHSRRTDSHSVEQKTQENIRPSTAVIIQV